MSLKDERPSTKLEPTQASAKIELLFHLALDGVERSIDLDQGGIFDKPGTVLYRGEGSEFCQLLDSLQNSLGSEHLAYKVRFIYAAVSFAREHRELCIFDDTTMKQFEAFEDEQEEIEKDRVNEKNTEEEIEKMRT